MFITVRNLLSTSQLEQIHRELEGGTFQSGKATAGVRAKQLKKNLQLNESDPCAQRAGQLVVAALQSNEPFLISARPQTILAPMFCRYESQMEYGKHLDNPLMRGGAVRTDVSVTVFLSPADSYEGGELTIDSDFGPIKVKGDAGDAVVYPSTAVHGVAEVTSGHRLVAVTWVQSMIRNAEQRKLLFDLAILERRLKEQGVAESQLAEKCHFNLFRMWAEM